MNIGQIVRHNVFLNNKTPSELKDECVSLLDRVAELEKQVKEDFKQKMVSYAEQQLIGFDSKWKGDSITSLISSMSLSKDEWETLKAGNITWLSTDLYHSIEDYFSEDK